MKHLVFALFLTALPWIMGGCTDPKKAQKDTLDADRNLVSGQLENGLRYYIYPNPEPPKHVSMRLYVNAGSLMETEAQQGLAHFIEHMVFKGTKHYSSWELIHYFERLGMAFGPDTNAHTGFDETVYQLELPGNTKAYVMEGLRVFRDIAANVLFEYDSINAERGVILAEKRARNSAGYRSAIDALAFQLPNTLLPKRLPIGQEEVIQNAPRDEFTSYYNHWYRPDRMAVVITGDIDRLTALDWVHQTMSELENPIFPAPDPEIGIVTPRGIEAKVFVDTEFPSSTVMINCVRNRSELPDSVSERVREIHEQICCHMLSRRLERAALEEDSPFSGAGCATSELVKEFQVNIVAGETQNAYINQTLDRLEQELRKAVVYGFTDKEFGLVQRQILQAAESVVDRKATRLASDLATDIAEHINNNRVFLSPEQEYALVEKAIAELSLSDCQDILKEMFPTNDRLIYVASNEAIPGGAPAILQAYKNSQQVPVDPHEEEETPDLRNVVFGDSQQASEHFFHQGVNVHTLEYANGVKVHLKHTEYELDTIYVSARFGGGKLSEPQDKPGLSLLAKEAFLLGGLNRISYQDLQDYSAGLDMNIGFTGNAGFFELQGRCNRRDLKTQLAVLALYLTEPAFEDHSIAFAQRNLETYFESLDKTAESVFQHEGLEYLSNKNPVLTTPDPDRVYGYTIEELRDWFKPIATGAPIQMSIVGDFNYDELIDALSDTFGAIAERTYVSQIPEGAEDINFATGPAKAEFLVNTPVQRALCTMAWPTVNGGDFETVSKLNILAAVFEDRLLNRLRISMGEVYSPGVGNINPFYLDGLGFMHTFTTVAPESADRVLLETLRIADDLASGAKPISDDEFVRASQPYITRQKDNRRRNAFWLAELATAWKDPTIMDWASREIPFLGGISKEAISVTAAEFLKADKRVEMRFIPNPEIEVMEVDEDLGIIPTL